MKGDRIIDADAHFVEPESMWPDYLEPAFREAAPRTIGNAAGPTHTVIAGHVLPPLWSDYRDTPGSRLSEAISRFCSTDHRRRLSPRVITSTRWLRTLIRSVVRASPKTAPLSANSSSIIMGDTHHNFTASCNVGSALR